MHARTHRKELPLYYRRAVVVRVDAAVRFFGVANEVSRSITRKHFGSGVLYRYIINE